MTNERFWKSFWLLFAGTALVCLAGSAALFFNYIGTIDTAAVGLDYTPDKDPFAGSLRRASTAITGGSIYQDALPLGLSAWTWDASLDTRSQGQVFDGSAALRAVFSKAWGGFGINGFSVDTSANPTLTLSVYPDAQTGDLYLQLYDAKGKALALQSLGWYTPGGALVPGRWQTVVVPVQNLLGSSTAATVTALSINTTSPGNAYIDSVRFSTAPGAHEPWVYHAPEGPDGSAYAPQPYNPFATSTPAALPYTFTPSPKADDRWYSPRGLFEQTYNGFKIGPQKGVNQDALAYFRSGRGWSDYQVSATVTWGSAQVFAIVVRLQDEKNYSSCSYSNQSDTIQMYNVVDGTSHLVGQSDKIHYGGYTGGEGTIGATAYAGTLVCSSAGKRVLSRDVPGMPAQGTVGMEVWDENDATSAQTVTTFSVVPMVGE